MIVCSVLPRKYSLYIYYYDINICSVDNGKASMSQLRAKVNSRIIYLQSENMHLLLIIIASHLFSMGFAETSGCQPFNKIYTSGKHMCEAMWNNVFKVIPDKEVYPAYTPGFYDEINPNTETTKQYATPFVLEELEANFASGTMDLDFLSSPDNITLGETFISGPGIQNNTKILSGEGLQYVVSKPFTLSATISTTVYLHGFAYDSNGYPECKMKGWRYEFAQPQEKGEFSACNNYHEASCCKPETVSSFEKINENYGEQYHSDRCGPISDECKSYFMAEACMYECDPSMGLFRVWSDEEVDAAIEDGTNYYYNFVNSTPYPNNWQIASVPIREGFCNNWYRACYNDNFCSDGSGDFFACDRIFVEPLTEDQKSNSQLKVVNIPYSCKIFNND